MIVTGVWPVGLIHAMNHATGVRNGDILHLTFYGLLRAFLWKGEDFSCIIRNDMR